MKQDRSRLVIEADVADERRRLGLSEAVLEDLSEIAVSRRPARPWLRGDAGCQDAGEDGLQAMIALDDFSQLSARRDDRIKIPHQLSGDLTTAFLPPIAAARETDGPLVFHVQRRDVARPSEVIVAVVWPLPCHRLLRRMTD